MKWCVSALIVAGLVCSACANTGRPQDDAMSKILAASDRMAKETRERERATRMPSGWRVDCEYDDILGARECFAGKFGREIAPMPGIEQSSGAELPFNLRLTVFNNGAIVGPSVDPGRFHCPGTKPIVRVDAHDATTEMNSPTLIQELRVGRIAQAEYCEGPSIVSRYNLSSTGVKRFSVELSGFEEAYQRLVELSGARDPSTQELPATSKPPPVEGHVE